MSTVISNTLPKACFQEADRTASTHPTTHQKPAPKTMNEEGGKPRRVPNTHPQRAK